MQITTLHDTACWNPALHAQEGSLVGRTSKYSFRWLLTSFAWHGLNGLFTQPPGFLLCREYPSTATHCVLTIIADLCRDCRLSHADIVSAVKPKCSSLETWTYQPRQHKNGASSIGTMFQSYKKCGIQLEDQTSKLKALRPRFPWAHGI